MTIRTLPLETIHLEQSARILVAALAHARSAWHDLAEARAEAAAFVGSDERLAFAALDGERMLGWIGAIRHSRHLWELHPLVVDPAEQGRGFGSLLVETLENAAREAGVATLWLGTDDDFGGTSLFGVDLYPDVLDKLKRLSVTTRHPFTFYRARGYSVVGALPDASGPGRHDILMAKRVDGAPR
jgi:aminoglycoside 6'-N-acetyltransferase I